MYVYISCFMISIECSKMSVPVRAVQYNNSICPAQLKLARVTPIYKQGSKTDVDNYRPISVLPVISKILEKHVCKHFIAFLTN